MNDQDWLADRFEQHRTRLRGVAYRMLGSLGEAEDAVQEAWLRLSRVDAGEVNDLGAWLTTVVARICLNALRSRAARREELMDLHLPDPVVSAVDGVDPENEALIADSVGFALLIVLDSLAPAERLAFVLHDIFDVPFEQIARIVNRSEPAARQLASRARRRIRTRATRETDLDADLREQWEVVDAFLAAARDGDFEALLNLLDPEVVRRVDSGPTGPDLPRVLHGAEAVATSAMAFNQRRHSGRRVLVNGAPGFISFLDGDPFALLAFTIARGRVVEMNILADPVRLRQLDLTV